MVPFSHLIDAGTDRVTWSSNAGRNRALRRLLWTGKAPPPNPPVCISRRLIIRTVGGHQGSLADLSRVFPPETLQQDVYDVVGRDVVNDIAQGFNGTIFA